LEVSSEVDTDEFRDDMVGIGLGSEFFTGRPDVGFSSLGFERVSSIEEEPHGGVLFFEVNVQHNSVILNIILDTEGISLDENVIVIDFTDKDVVTEGSWVITEVIDFSWGIND